MMVVSMVSTLVKKMDYHKRPRDQHPAYLKFLGALVSVITFVMVAFFIWVATLAVGEFALEEDEEDGCVVLVEFIRVIGIVSLCVLSCAGCCCCIQAAVAPQYFTSRMQ